VTGDTAPSHEDRFPGFDVLAQSKHWDAVTTGVVLARIGMAPDIRFFTPSEQAVATALCDQLLDQSDDPQAGPKVPVVNLIDARLAERQTDGWHYHDLPEDSQAWRDTLAALDADAHAAHAGRSFAALVSSEQAVLVQAVQDRAGGGQRWHAWPAMQVWSLWTRYACTAFYSHPWAWNEIGFPGPAYPRGYLNAGVGSRERWERPDRVDADPGLFAARVETARREHARLVGQEDQ
jgi:hypothetical protein